MVIIITIALIVGLASFLLIHWHLKNNPDTNPNENSSSTTEYDYDIQYASVPDNNSDWYYTGGTDALTYDEYVNLCKRHNFAQHYNDPDATYLVDYYVRNSQSGGLEVSLTKVKLDNTTATLYIQRKNRAFGNSSAYLIVVPTDQDIQNVESVYTGGDI